MIGYGYGKFCIDMFKNGRDLVFIGDVIMCLGSFAVVVPVGSGCFLFELCGC